MNRYFLITSSGAAATRWLGASLNSHPEICCSCGSGELAETLVYGRPNTQEHIDRVAQFLWERCMGATAETRPVDVMFSELEAHRSARVYGNVHGETLTTLAANVRDHRLTRPVTVVNLVRHPVPRTESKFGMIQHDCQASNVMRRVCEFQLQDRLNRMAPVTQAIREQIGDFERISERRYFVSALLDTVGASSEFTQTVANELPPQYCIEALKGNREAFQAFLVHITGGQVSIAADYLDTVFSSSRLNSERYRAGATAQTPPRTPEEQWQAWADWQQRAFQAAMECSRFHTLFQRVGYTFDFVGRPRAPLFPGFGRREGAPAVSAPALFNQMP